ncbi:tyrosine-type recombinase/integrase [Laceyella tengchongensis]|uniref:tyrosine-type recombinase/integrase n=1 Tax=Laceyella tengchongensis TaxID=574699 RepID=UPI002549946E|nr:tyrosine-type recombinase/integrase [Laceyella tengchongensis]
MLPKNGRRGRAKLERALSRSNETLASLPELVEMYIYAKQAEGTAKGTLTNKRLAVNKFLQFVEDNGHQDVSLRALSVQTVREFISYLRYNHVKHENNQFVDDDYKTAGLSPSTVNTHLKHLRDFFNFLKSEKYTDDNPFHAVKLVKEPVDAVEALTMDEIKRLVRIPDTKRFAGFRDYVLIVLLLDTGLRISEALALTADDIDFKTQNITVKAENAKSGKFRFVPFSPKTGRLLKELIAEVKEIDCVYLFCTVYGNPLEREIFRKRLKRYAEEAGITRKVSPHVLRHSFATQYLLNNGDVMSLQKILGHSSISMVRRYVQMTDADISKTHAKFSPIQNIRV